MEPLEKESPPGRKGFNPVSLKNLIPITKEQQSKGGKVASQRRKERALLAREFTNTAAAMMHVVDKLPVLQAVDIMRIAMHKALAELNYEDAARWASQIAEYERPKLQRIEQSSTLKMDKLSDEELKKIIASEGL